MTTAQESTNGHRVFQSPASAENTPEPTSADLPANQDNISSNIAPSASAYHVPPKRFAPRPNAYAYDDSFHRPPETEPLPDRCQFMFSDGRQCTMARSDIHPSLCVYHSEREEQLFGDPFCESHIRGRSYDLPELFSASRDLSTAAGVNRALAQVFRLLAQRRISRQEAATFGHLAKLLLRTISLMAAESQSDEETSLPRKGYQQDALFAGNKVIPSSGESLFAANVYQQDELRGVNKDHQELSPVNNVYHERGIPPEVFPHHKLAVAATLDTPRPNEGGVILSESALADEPKALSVPLATSPNSAMSPIAASPEAPAPRLAMSNSRKISTSTASICNSPETNTYENVELQPLQNQHLHKRAAPEALASPTS